jgi:hypothetical protein
LGEAAQSKGHSAQRFRGARSYGKR